MADGAGDPTDAPRTATEFASRQARAAWDLGHAAMDEGAFEVAWGWFGRACRIAPTDLTPRLSLALACLNTGRTAEAVRLFREVAGPTDAAAAWLGLAAACARTGDWAAAAAALQPVLSRHVAEADTARLADAVAREAGFAGWCGLDPSGRIVVGGTDEVRLRRDGRALSAAASGYAPPLGAMRLDVTAAGGRLLGSPIRLDAIRRIEGVVEVDPDGGLSGWAWHPGDARRTPSLTLVAGPVRRMFRATDISVTAPRPLTQPRGFRVTPTELADLAEPIDVVGPDGLALLGSPVSPRGLAAISPIPVGMTSSPPAAASRCPDRAVAIVVPVYRGARETLACLRDVIATAPAGTAVIVVDDASPEPGLGTALDRLAAAGRVRLLRHARNRGFPAAANTGLRAVLDLGSPYDVVLLNSDTRMATGWVERLRTAVHGTADIGTATPLSNDATIASYPDPAGANAPPAGAALARLSRLAARANPEAAIDVPTGVGFCLYLRHECLTQTGRFRDDVFAQGYGEENDFCLRAASLGWRHVVVPGAYVAHLGGRSFGTARDALLARNLRVLERLHPGYRARVEGWIARDPLAPARRRLDLLRWEARSAGARRASPAGAVLLVTHDHGGGVERCVQERLVALRAGGHWPILLRPVLDRRETADAVAPRGSDRRTVPGLIRVQDGAEPAAFPNLVFRLPDERAELEAALRLSRPAWMEVHHLLGHSADLPDLAPALSIPTDWRLHDYAAFCPRITLTDAVGRYCGEPDVAGCVACVAEHGSLLDEAIGPTALRARSTAWLRAARRVIAPSADMQARMRRHFAAVAITVGPHEADPAGPLSTPDRAAIVTIAVVGAIGRAKGYDVLLDCARDAAARGLGLRFVVVGRTIDDDALLRTGCVDVTGPYREGQAAALLAEQRAQLGFIPSLWPETWCFALGEILRAGLPAVAFDIGAQAERVRRTGRGWILPLGAPASAINRFLLRPPPLPLAVLVNVMHTASNRKPIRPQPTSERIP